MTNEDTVRMALEAGFPVLGPKRTKAAERFAALVAAAERKRFADECIDIVAFHGGSVEIEAAIRARSQS